MGPVHGIMSVCIDLLSNNFSMAQLIASTLGSD